MSNPFTHLREIYTQEACETPSVLELLFELEKKYDDIIAEIDGKIAEFEQLLVPINNKIANLELNQSDIFEQLSVIRDDINSLYTQKLDKDTTHINTLYGKGSSADSQVQLQYDQTGEVANAIAQRDSAGSVVVPIPSENSQCANKKYVDDSVNKVQSNVINENILINSNFLINQRGASFYNLDNAPNNHYTVDRWLILTNNHPYTLTPVSGGGITLAYTDTKMYVDLIQIIENGESLLGKDLCISAKINGKLYYASGNFTSLTAPLSVKIYDENGVEVCRLRLAHSSALHLVYADIMLRPQQTITIDYVKVEGGLVPTPNVYIDPETDFERCQHYAQKIRVNGAVSIATSTSTIYAAVPIPVRLRTAPTVTSVSQVSIREIGYGIRGNATPVYNNLYDNFIQFQASVESLGITLNAGIVWANGEIFADSEIYWGA